VVVRLTLTRPLAGPAPLLTDFLPAARYPGAPVGRRAIEWICTAGLAAALLGAPAVALLAVPAAARAQLSTRDTTPFPPSKVVTGAAWSTRPYGPPGNQYGDILPTIWADDGNQYTMITDGGTGIKRGLWRQSLARITGSPPNIHFQFVGNPKDPPPHTYTQIQKNPALWTGPLGPYYSSGLVEADHVFYATQEDNWNWNANDPFAGLEGIAYSTNRGQSWSFGGKPFPAPLGNLSWVVQGRGGAYPDGWVYAVATEREFNASTMIMGRARPEVADLTNPADWQWVSGWTTQGGEQQPQYSSSLASAVPILSWASHITYPQMAYDSPIHRYLLTFTYSYVSSTPGIWRDGAALVILDAPHPWGPFSFVALQRWFGPSNGYGAGIPPAWISPNGQDLWLKWAANFDGCAAHLNCSGGYGFNYRQIHLTLASER
jgi:hypothetical protein